MNIKNLPKHEQPREKLIEKGPQNLRDAELMAILLRTGIEGKDVMKVSEEILKANPKKKLLSLDFESLSKIKGIGPSKASLLLAAFELTKRALDVEGGNLPLIISAKDAVAQLQELRNAQREHFVVLYLNAREELVHKETISIGTLNANLVHPREVFKPAIDHLAAFIVIAHNHPSGSLEPSLEDRDVTKRLIVCSMWITGFDAPVVSTMYLDKPMKNHTLMQTIARANRVATGKNNGLIVDYIGVFRNLQKALAIYGSVGDQAEKPIKAKDELVEQLQETLKHLGAFCKANALDIAGLRTAKDFEKLAILNECVDAILVDEETKNEFLSLSNTSAQLFGAIMPDKEGGQFFEEVKLYRVLAERVRILTQKEVNVDEVANAIETLLDSAIQTDGYTISDDYKPYDLSKIDFEKLQTFFEKNKHLQTEKLKQTLSKKLKELVQRNPTRDTLIQSFEKLLEEYNSGSKNIEEFFEALMKFAQTLTEEEQRGMREELTEEELAIFDLLYKPELKEPEIKAIKSVAKDLLERLKDTALVLDWRRTQQGRASVLVTIKDVLYEELPELYDEGLIETKTMKIFSHIYESYPGDGVNVYA